MSADPNTNCVYNESRSRRRLYGSGVIVMLALFHSAWPECRPNAGVSAPPRPSTATATSSPTGLPRTTERRAERNRMVDQQMATRDIHDRRVLEAMRNVPRHWFVPDDMSRSAYDDRPLPIGWDQTISQPYIVALMTTLAQPRAGQKILEIGTGSGYQAAVLDEIADSVFTIEIHPALAERARASLDRLGYGDVRVRTGDGYRGWPEEAPFDAIVVTAAPDHVPRPLLEQLKIGGRLVLPVGKNRQQLQVWTRTERGFETKNLIPVQFVPMTGEAQGEKTPDGTSKNPTK